MIQQRILFTGLFIAIVSVALSNDAEARWRCRNRFNSYGYNTTYTYTYTYGTGTQFSANNQAVNQGATITTPAVPQINSVNRPTYDDPSMPANQIPATAPQPVLTNPARVIVNPAPVNNGPGNTLPSNPEAAQVQTNSSPNPDNEGRNASKIPGTAPTKAPAPAANANP